MSFNRAPTGSESPKRSRHPTLSPREMGGVLAYRPPNSALAPPHPVPLPQGEGTTAQRRLAIAAEHWQLAEGLEVQLQGVAQQVGDRPEAA